MQGNCDKWRRILFLETSFSNAIRLAGCLQNVVSHLLWLNVQEHTCHALHLPAEEKEVVAFGILSPFEARAVKQCVLGRGIHLLYVCGSFFLRR